MPGFEAVLRYGLAAPAGTPPAVIARLNKELNAALASEDVKSRLATEGAEALPGTPEVILMGTGTEVSLCVVAFEHLKAEGVRARVVSIPSWELFEQQPKDYRDGVLPPTVRARVAVEQASTVGWARYTGTTGEILGMKTFGASAPLKVLQEEFGFTKEHVVSDAKAQLGRK